MQITVKISPLAHEFWPFEGVLFAAESNHNELTVVSRLCGDMKYKGHVDLRFLDSADVQIVHLDEPDSLCAVRLTGSIEAINISFLGFGLMFRKDFESRDRLTLDVEGDSTYTFLIDLE